MAVKLRRFRRRGLFESFPVGQERMPNPPHVTLCRAGFGGMFPLYRGEETDARAERHGREMGDTARYLLDAEISMGRRTVCPARRITPPMLCRGALFFLRRGCLPRGVAKCNAPFPGITPGAPGGNARGPAEGARRPVGSFGLFIFRPGLSWSSHRDFYPVFAIFLFSPRGLFFRPSPRGKRPAPRDQMPGGPGEAPVAPGKTPGAPGKIPGGTG